MGENPNKVGHVAEVPSIGTNPRQNRGIFNPKKRSDPEEEKNRKRFLELIGVKEKLRKPSSNELVKSSEPKPKSRLDERA